MAISSEVEAKQVRIVKGTGSQIASARQAGEILDTDLVVQTDAPEPATAEQGALADTALQPEDNITELVNNAGYQTSSQVNTAISSHNTDQSAHSYIQGLISSEESRAEGVEGTLSNLTTDVKNNLVSAINEVDSHTDTNTSDISDINALIPNDATAQNQLADKSFVNSSIATNTANFIGTFNSVAELEAYSGTLTNNDYAFVIGTDTAGNTVYDRYKYTDATTPASWIFEYELNNSSFTADQWAAINSLATAGKITQITTNQNAIGTLSSLTTTAKTSLVSAINELDSDKLDKNTAITGATKCKITYDGKGLVTGGADLSAGDIPSLTLSKISDITATASELNVLDGITASTTELNYTDGVTSNIQTQLNGKVPNTRTVNGKALSSNVSLTASDVGALPDSTTIGDATLTIQKNGTTIDTFTANATTNKTIDISVPTDTSDLTNGAGYITKDVNDLTNYTLTSSLGSAAYASTTDFATSTQGGKADSAIQGVKVNGTELTPDADKKVDVTIPTVNNATLTIQKNGTNVATFTANSSSNKTANITVPTDTNDLTNGAGYITGISSGDVTTALGYTPYNSSNPAGYISGITSAMVTTALGYTPYNSTNPNGYQANVIETVKVNGSALTPSNKAVDITVPTVNNSTITIQKNGTTVDSFTTNASSGKTINITVPTQASDIGAQATLVSGTNIKTVNNQSLLGSGNIEIQSAPDVDSKSISLNSSDELQTIGVIDQNNTTTALKQWSGTKAQYDAIATKDANTVYNITDDTLPSNLANVDLSNLSQTGQAVIDGKANTSLSNLDSTGQALFTAKLDADKIQQVSTLPASPVAGTLYLIPE